MDWEPEHVEAIYNMLVENQSAATIAKTLKRSRNAILGKIHRDERLKRVAALKYQSKAKRQPSKHPNSVVPKVKGNTEVIPLPEPKDLTPSVGRPMVKLEAGMCLWAVNNAEVGELHLFCGAATVDHACGEGTKPSRYCARHLSLSERPVARKATGKDHRDYIVNARRKW